MQVLDGSGAIFRIGAEQLSPIAVEIPAFSRAEIAQIVLASQVADARAAVLRQIASMIVVIPFDLSAVPYINRTPQRCALIVPHQGTWYTLAFEGFCTREEISSLGHGSQMIRTLTFCASVYDAVQGKYTGISPGGPADPPGPWLPPGPDPRDPYIPPPPVVYDWGYCCIATPYYGSGFDSPDYIGKCVVYVDGGRVAEIKLFDQNEISHSGDRIINPQPGSPTETIVLDVNDVYSSVKLEFYGYKVFQNFSYDADYHAGVWTGATVWGYTPELYVNGGTLPTAATFMRVGCRIRYTNIPTVAPGAYPYKDPEIYGIKTAILNLGDRKWTFENVPGVTYKSYYAHSYP